MAEITKPAEIINPGYFQSETDGRRWEFDAKNEQLVTFSRKVDVLFIGDSITHLWELNADFRHLGYVVNRGISGDRVHFLSRRFEADAVQLKPLVTVMLIGVNNTWDVCDEKATPETSDEVYALFCEHYNKIMELVRENNMRVILCSVQPTRCGNSAQDALILRMNEKIKELSREYNVPYIDYYNAMVADDGHTYPEMYSTDGLHPNAIGYHKMTEILMPELEKQLRAVKENGK